MSEQSGSDPSRPRSRRPPAPGDRRPNPATAGTLLVAAIVGLGLLGLGIGALVGLPVPFTFAGLFAGAAVGFAVVYSRFKDI